MRNHSMLRGVEMSALTAVLTAVSWSVASASVVLEPKEIFTAPLRVHDMGSRDSGTAALSETGFQVHGAFGSPNVAIGPRRYYQGEFSEVQAAGSMDIAYKNARPSGDEYISNVYASGGPTMATAYYGGGSFDGTALWLSHSLFNAGGAPAVGTSSGPTTGTDPAVVAGVGVDLRYPNADRIQLPVITGNAYTASYHYAADVYVPSHTAAKSVFFGVYADRADYGLFIPGGQAMFNLSLPYDQWNLVEVRLDFTIDGGVLDGSSDDTMSLVRRIYLNGSLINTATLIGNTTQMTSRTGPVQFSPSFGLQRGWQGSVAEAYIDNVVLSQILLIPEPTTALLLAFGGLLTLRRRSRS